MTGVIDNGAGNLGSVMNALDRLSIPSRFVRGPEELNPASTPFRGVIFPGDGHFATAMEALDRSGYAEAIREWIRAERPFLGICIGLQLLFEKSEEAGDETERKGLALIRGEVKKFPCRKVPQIGWNQTRAKKNSRLFAGLPDETFFYYIHSYYAAPFDASDIAAETDYCLSYCSAVERGALAAVQFHPEKSGAAGLKLLENWHAG
ncbi:MAG: imidazole glycerol phosphate synthase subunit HisH [Spirochaetaceae bacterium]|nr:imidazole glycerol phosphate synthase subunit HisH [Spirochaetaceae bacterium]